MESCYYCGKPKDSREHIPPQSFFPKGHRVNLITVPSCDKHNSDKSDIDEYVRTLFIGTTPFNNQKIIDVVNTSIRSLVRNQGSKYNIMFKDSIEVNLKNGDTTVSVAINTEYLKIFTISILKGIFFYEYNFIWSDEIATRYYFSDENSSADEKISKMNLSENFIKENAKGENKDIFYYSPNLNPKCNLSI